MMNTEDIQKTMVEIERRWRERTPAKQVDEVDPGYRVSRGEMRRWCSEQNVQLDEHDEGFQVACLRLYARLRKEFPDELWRPFRDFDEQDKALCKRFGIRVRNRRKQKPETIFDDVP